jgi:hypothetical protein
MHLMIAASAHRARVGDEAAAALGYVLDVELAIRLFAERLA